MYYLLKHVYVNCFNCLLEAERRAAKIFTDFFDVMFGVFSPRLRKALSWRYSMRNIWIRWLGFFQVTAHLSWAPLTKLKIKSDHMFRLKFLSTSASSCVSVSNIIVLGLSKCRRYPFAICFLYSCLVEDASICWKESTQIFMRGESVVFRYYVMRKQVVEKVLRLSSRKEKYLVVAAVRFLRTCISLKVYSDSVFVLFVLILFLFSQ